MSDLFNTETQIDPDFDYYSALVGEGKKYKDPKAAGLAIVHKDQHISKIEQENAALRKELEGKLAIDAFLDKLNARTVTQTPNGSNTEPAVEPNPAQIQNKGLSLEDVQKFIAEQEAQRTAEANMAKAIAKLKEAFGANYTVNLEAKANELGVNKDFLTSIAKTSPDALVKLVGADKAPDSTGTVPNSSVRSVPSVGQTSGKKFADYQKVLKEEPRRYWSSAFQAEMHREAEKQGEAFYN